MRSLTRLVAILATNVREKRRSQGVSQEELAEMVGVDVRYLGGIERGQRNPSLKVICALADALSVDVIALLAEPDD